MFSHHVSEIRSVSVFESSHIHEGPAPLWTPNPLTPLTPPPISTRISNTSHSHRSFHSFVFLWLFWAPLPSLFFPPPSSPLPLQWIQLCLMEPVMRNVSGLHTTTTTTTTPLPTTPARSTPDRSDTHIHSQEGSSHCLTFGNVPQTHTRTHPRTHSMCL